MYKIIYLDTILHLFCNFCNKKDAEIFFKIGMDNFFNRLQGVINYLGMSQSDLARVTGIRHQVISRWKTTGKTPGLRTLQKIVKATGCSPLWLQHGVEPVFPHYNVDFTLDENTNLGDLFKKIESFEKADQGLIDRVSKDSDIAKLVELLSGYAGPEEIKALLIKYEQRKRESESEGKPTKE